MKKILIAIAALSLTTANAFGATLLSNFTATATVANTCTLTTAASNVAFGLYTINTVQDAAGSAVVNCTSGAPYTTYITGSRVMTSGLNNLNFELYSDAGRTTVYGSALAGGLADNGTGADQTINYYGRIPAQTVASGNYSAALVFTVEY